MSQPNGIAVNGALFYRDVEELLAERGLHADHVTVWRWVQCYAPEMERRLRKRLKATNDSWPSGRETYVRVKGNHSSGRPHGNLLCGDVRALCRDRGFH
jgi:transposase-like protein